MTKKIIKSAKYNLNLDWIKLISGLFMLIGAAIGVKMKDKNKYYGLAGLVAGVCGIGLIATELEDNFKPIEYDEESEDV